MIPFLNCDTDSLSQMGCRELIIGFALNKNANLFYCSHYFGTICAYCVDYKRGKIVAILERQIFFSFCCSTLPANCPHVLLDITCD